MMKILEEGKVLYEKGLEDLSTNDMSSINGGWCLILICGANMSSILSFMMNNRLDSSLMV